VACQTIQGWYRWLEEEDWRAQRLDPGYSNIVVGEAPAWLGEKYTGTRALKNTKQAENQEPKNTIFTKPQIHNKRSPSTERTKHKYQKH
jgi:hypothetical protein